MKFEPTKSIPLLRRLAKLLVDIFPSKLVIDLALDPQLPAAITVDANQINQALLNLCINARDAMRDGGRLLLQSRTVSVAELPEVFPVLRRTNTCHQRVGYRFGNGHGNPEPCFRAFFYNQRGRQRDRSWSFNGRTLLSGIMKALSISPANRDRARLSISICRSGTAVSAKQKPAFALYPPLRIYRPTFIRK